MLSLLRFGQWSKSLLVFVPFLLTLNSMEDLGLSVLAFLSFALASSSGYSLNDALDQEFDKFHPQKKNRPVASGLVSKNSAFGIAAALAVISVLVATEINSQVAIIVVAYLVLVIVYSIWLKKKAIVDVIVLSSFYLFRLLAGASAISVEVSSWLLSFALFAFISLGFAKRYTELRAPKVPSFVPQKMHSTENGRGYLTADSSWVLISGISMGTLSVLVLALYLDLGRLESGFLQFLIVPLWAYWILRMWLTASRETLHHDPTAFAVRDQISWLVALAMVALLIFGQSIEEFLEQAWMAI
mgnify:CR=1 FL=1